MLGPIKGYPVFHIKQHNVTQGTYKYPKTPLLVVFLTSETDFWKPSPRTPYFAVTKGAFQEDDILMNNCITYMFLVHVMIWSLVFEIVMGSATLLAFFGLKAVFDFHSEKEIPHTYSLHSWFDIMPNWYHYLLDEYPYSYSHISSTHGLLSLISWLTQWVLLVLVIVFVLVLVLVLTYSLHSWFSVTPNWYHVIFFPFPYSGKKFSDSASLSLSLS